MDSGLKREWSPNGISNRMRECNGVNFVCLIV